MNCSFSGRSIPIDKLFVLYYPPAAAHEAWDKSFYAAARAREALAAIREELEAFFPRRVATGKIALGLLGFLAGLAVAVYWGTAIDTGWAGMGFAQRYLVPLLALALLQFGGSRLRAFLERGWVWRHGGRDTVVQELAAIRKILEELPDDPDAEEAAAILRRECPEVISELAFYGTNYRAFTYMDFVLSPKLQHPDEQKELPQEHSPYRDAYYVGEVVYDNWRTFHKDRRRMTDPRFAGSGGRRGVI